MAIACINQKTPLLSVSEWVQGGPINFDQLLGRVVLVEVFQVNCPGCFLYAIPNAINLYQHYAGRGLVVLGLATAFEDFDKNTLDNLKRLAYDAEVIGETQKALTKQGLLKNGKLPYTIPFPLAMDTLRQRTQQVTETEIDRFIQQHFTESLAQPVAAQLQLRQRVRQHLDSLQYHAETFEQFALKGTPSHILVDRQGYLQEIAFGMHAGLEFSIQKLLN